MLAETRKYVLFEYFPEELEYQCEGKPGNTTLEEVPDFPTSATGMTTSNTDSDSTTLPSPTTSGSESHSTTLNLIDSNVDTLDAVLETVDEGETLVDEEETVSEV